MEKLTKKQEKSTEIPEKPTKKQEKTEKNQVKNRKNRKNQPKYRKNHPKDRKNWKNHTKYRKNQVKNQKIWKNQVKNRKKSSEKQEQSEESEESEDDRSTDHFLDSDKKFPNDQKKKETEISDQNGNDTMHFDDDFDRLVHEMSSDLRAVAAEPLKTPEEIARAEKEKLEQLETARLRRMHTDNNDPRDSACDSDNDALIPIFRREQFYKRQKFKRSFTS